MLLKIYCSQVVVFTLSQTSISEKKGVFRDLKKEKLYTDAVGNSFYVSSTQTT